MKVLLLMSENPRASITCARELDKNKIQTITAFINDKKFEKIIVSKLKYNENNVYSTDSERDFIDSLIKINIKREPVKIFLFGDKVSLWLINNRTELQKYNYDITAPEMDAYLTMVNKYTFLKTGEKFGLSQPPLIDKNILNQKFNRKFVIKPKSNLYNNVKKSSLDSPYLVENKKSLENLKKINIDKNNHIIQKYLEGDSYYYTAYYQEGRKLICFSQKNLVQQPGGKSILKSVPSSLPLDLIEKVDSLFSYFSWSGPTMIEFKKEGNQFYLIECNPRLWGPLQLAVDNGVNYPLTMYNKVENYQKVDQTIGYKWINGYILGLFYIFKTKSLFRKYKDSDLEKIRFQDLWFRKDTMTYAFLEVFLTLKNSVKKRLKF